MSKNCAHHQCFKATSCPEKIWLGYLPLCKNNKITCSHCAPRPYGRYEIEDVRLP